MATIKKEVHKLSSEAARVMDENAALGGSLEISSSEKGTTVTAIVPATLPKSRRLARTWLDPTGRLFHVGRPPHPSQVKPSTRTLRAETQRLEPKACFTKTRSSINNG